MKKTDGECLFSDSLHFFTSFSWIFFLKKLCYGSARCWGNKIQEKSAGPDVVARLCVHNITVIWIFFFLENIENLLFFKKWLWCIRAADGALEMRCCRGHYSGRKGSSNPNRREGASSDTFQRSREGRVSNWACWGLRHCAFALP